MPATWYQPLDGMSHDDTLAYLEAIARYPFVPFGNAFVPDVLRAAVDIGVAQGYREPDDDEQKEIGRAYWEAGAISAAFTSGPGAAMESMRQSLMALLNKAESCGVVTNVGKKEN